MAMAGYTKLFNSILASTIWRADDKTRIVWITLLAMADKHGVAEGSVPGLADFARVSVPACRRALEALAAPDPDSRSQEHDGRRIQAVDGGWQLLNYDKYRTRLNALWRGGEASASFRPTGRDIPAPAGLFGRAELPILVNNEPFISSERDISHAPGSRPAYAREGPPAGRELQPGTGD